MAKRPKSTRLAPHYKREKTSVDGKSTGSRHFGMSLAHNRSFASFVIWPMLLAILILALSLFFVGVVTSLKLLDYIVVVGIMMIVAASVGFMQWRKQKTKGFTRMVLIPPFVLFLVVTTYVSALRLMFIGGTGGLPVSIVVLMAVIFTVRAIQWKMRRKSHSTSKKSESYE